MKELIFLFQDLNTNLVNSYQALRDSTKNLITEKNELEKEKNELENQSKEHFSQIEKLTANYVNILINNIIYRIQNNFLTHFMKDIFKFLYII